MKMSINKKYVEDYQMERVKADAKEFKAMYTDADILNSFREQLKDYRTYTAEIVYCKVEAMDSGWARGNETTFCVEMLVEDFRKMYKLRFYVGMNLEVDNRPNLVTVREFDEVF